MIVMWFCIIVESPVHKEAQAKLPAGGEWIPEVIRLHSVPELAPVSVVSQTSFLEGQGGKPEYGGQTHPSSQKPYPHPPGLTQLESVLCQWDQSDWVHSAVCWV